MSKITALGMTINLDDSSGTPTNITNDCTDITWATPRGVIDVSGLDKTGYERLLGRSDITGTLTGVYNPSLSHGVLKTVPTQAGTVTRTLAIGLSSGTATGEVVVSDYSLSVGNDGKIGWTAPFSAANGTAIAWT